jgi:hypothetical protein
VLDIEVGQRWYCKDRSDPIVWVEVLAVEDERIQIQRFRKTWVRRDRFAKAYSLTR